MQLSDKIKKFSVEQAIDYLNKNPVKNLPKLLDWADTFCAGKFEGQRRAIRKACLDPTDAHYPMVQHILNDIDPAVLKTSLVNFFIYGISSCYTSVNWDAISSEAYFRQLIDLGCLFIWYFHYMPVGNDASPELLPTPEQRRAVLERIRHNRSTMPLFAMDFQNDAQYVGGCIAGGRRYLHINANGDMDPCVFIHYSDSNIREKTLLEAMRSPLFLAYHDGQPFNDNMLRPCPMLENPEKLRKIVADSGAHSTDPMSPETAEHLCSKCDGYAACWTPVAEQLWRGSPDEARYLAKQAAAAAKKK